MVVNMPTEEVFTTPDFRRVDGLVKATRPFHLTSGGSVEGLELRFAAGRVESVIATRGAELVRRQMAADPGAARLGEIALVDGSSPVGRAGRVFGDVLFDENATSHIAWGGAYAFTVPGPAARRGGARGARRQPLRRPPGRDDRRAGGRRVGLEAGGAEVPIIAGDAWVLS